MHEQTTVEEYITLTQAAKVVPCRPATNCMWRWCRRGVLSRGGERVRLQHVRIGGKIFTTARWLDEFGHKLAEADTKYFDLAEAAAEAAAAQNTPRHRRRLSPSRFEQQRREQIDAARRELDEAGY